MSTVDTLLDQLKQIDNAQDATSWARKNMPHIAQLNGDMGAIWKALQAKGLTASVLTDLQDIASRQAHRRQHENDPGAAFDKMLTDLGNARRFAKDHAGRILHTKAHGWLYWDGKRWAPDETGAAERLARLTVRRLWDEVDTINGKLRDLSEAASGDDQAANAEVERLKKRVGQVTTWAMKSQSRPRIEAMLALAKSEVDIAVNAEMFDANPWLLNVRNGTLDLQTATLRPHDPQDKLTKLVDVDYDPDASCPLWMAFIDKVLPDASVRDFMRRYTGYSLTGDTSEQSFAFLYGTGRNGKSVFADMVLRLTGEYGLKMSSATLTDTRRAAGAATEDIARLHGRRLYVANEWPENAPLAENFVKELTGGDVLAARFLNKGTFEFTPQGKLMVIGNHKPVIKGDDLGIWRRVRLVPFTVTIPENEVDPRLPEKLRAEMAGILTWAVEGCRDWQNYGLGLPEAVKAATADYKETSDVLGAWIAECCYIENPSALTATGALFASWQEWAKRNGHNPKNVTWFGRRLGERGYEKTDGSTPKRNGIALIASEVNGNE